MTTTTATIERHALQDLVYARLKERLVSRKVTPGERLGLNELAASFGVSRSPVYQALSLLAAEGLVAVRPRHGFFVAPLTAAVVLPAYDVRQALELQAAEQTVGTLGPDELDRLRAASDRSLPAVAGGTFVDTAAYIEANRAFHEIQIDLARNPVMSRIYRGLAVNELMERLLRDTTEVGNDVGAEHVELVAAFAAADLPRVQAAIRAHVATGKQIALDALDRAGGAL